MSDRSRSPARRMLYIHVAFPSGRHFLHAASPNCTVAAFSAWLRECHGCRFLRLVDTDATLLSAEDTLHMAGVRDGDQLTLVLQLPTLAATQKAFAQAGPDFLQAWGNPFWGGDLEELPPRSFGYPILAATCHSFAAILADGSLFTWGDPLRGGHLPGDLLPDALQQPVVALQHTDTAFAALCRNGSVCAWGAPGAGGDIGSAQPELRDVIALQANSGAFAALRADGSVVCWGDAASG